CGLPLAPTASASQGFALSRLDTRPVLSPVNASRPSLRAPTHDSGPVWVATPSPCDSCIRTTSSIYPGAPERSDAPRLSSLYDLFKSSISPRWGDIRVAAPRRTRLCEPLRDRNSRAVGPSGALSAAGRRGARGTRRGGVGRIAVRTRCFGAALPE